MQQESVNKHLAQFCLSSCHRAVSSALLSSPTTFPYLPLSSMPNGDPGSCTQAAAGKHLEEQQQATSARGRMDREQTPWRKLTWAPRLRGWDCRCYESSERPLWCWLTGYTAAAVDHRLSAPLLCSLVLQSHLGWRGVPRTGSSSDHVHPVKCTSLIQNKCLDD